MNDTPSLFAPATGLEPIPMADADVSFMHDFYRPPLSHQLMETLAREVAWRQEAIVLWGKEYLQPRLSAWYGDPDTHYTYSGMTLHPIAWSETLLRIRAEVETATGCRFNSVLLNLYRNERDSVGWHSDDEAVFGERPAIASLSLGETRTFRMRHKRRREQKRVALQLTDGSLLLMAGTTQQFWQHAIDKESGPLGARINLTFRTIRR